MLVVKKVMELMEEFKKNKLVEVKFKKTIGEPRFYFIVDNLEEENVEFWNSKMLEFEKEFKNEGLGIDVGTKESWDKNTLKFGWNSIEK